MTDLTPILHLLRQVPAPVWGTAVIASLLFALCFLAERRWGNGSSDTSWFIWWDGD